MGLVNALYDALRWTWANPTGYNVVSGIGSDLGELAIVGGLITIVRHHLCVEHRCFRLGHPDPAHGHPVCRRHSAHFDDDGRLPATPEPKGNL